MNLEITPDPIAPTSFGDGVLQKPRKSVPWPIIGGVAFLLLLIIVLMTR